MHVIELRERGARIAAACVGVRRDRVPQHLRTRPPAVLVRCMGTLLLCAMGVKAPLHQSMLRCVHSRCGEQMLADDAVDNHAAHATMRPYSAQQLSNRPTQAS